MRGHNWSAGSIGPPPRAVAGGSVVQRSVQRAVRRPQQARHLWPVRTTGPGGTVRIGGRASIANLGCLTAQSSRLGDRRLRNRVDGGIDSGDRLARCLTGSQADLPPDNPPAQLAPGHLRGVNRLRQPEEPVAAGNVRQEPVVVAVGSAEARRPAGQGRRPPQRHAASWRPPARDWPAPGGANRRAGWCL